MGEAYRRETVGPRSPKATTEPSHKRAFAEKRNSVNLAGLHFRSFGPTAGFSVRPLFV